MNLGFAVVFNSVVVMVTNQWKRFPTVVSVDSFLMRGLVVAKAIFKEPLNGSYEP